MHRKSTNFLLTPLLVFIMLVSSFAGEKDKFVSTSSECRFRSNEWQVDTSVTGLICAHGAGLGGDLGVSYFWSKYFGLGLDDSIVGHKRWNTVGAIGVDSLQASFFLRYPISSWNLAPYLMLGGGSIWGANSQGVGNIGGGIEYRITPNVGLFMDCRWLYGMSDLCNSSKGEVLSMTLTRIGMRFAF
jgi:hypothetical protein